MSPNAKLDAARKMLASLELTDAEVGELLASREPVAVPTVTDHLAAVVALATKASADTYRPYWRYLVAQHGRDQLDAIKPAHLATLLVRVRANAVQRRNGRGGVGAAENAIAAWRAFFAVAVAENSLASNPALAIDKPQRPTNHRHGIANGRLVELIEVTNNGGNDPHLDALLVRFHLETGARRGGAINLRNIDLDQDDCLVLLREKGNRERWQPVTPTLMAALVAHSRARGTGEAETAVFRYLPTANSLGGPLTRRRYNTHADRWQDALGWAKRDGVSIHWLRHTAATNIERIAGIPVARAFAGHKETRETTERYTKANQLDVARAFELMTGEAHPFVSRMDKEGSW